MEMLLNRVNQLQRDGGRGLRQNSGVRRELNRHYMMAVDQVLRATPAYHRIGLMRKRTQLPHGVPYRFVSTPDLASQCVTVSFQIRDEDLPRVSALEDRMAMQAGASSVRIYRDLSVMRVEFLLPEAQWMDVPLGGLPHRRNRACVGLRTLGSPAVIDWKIPHKTVFGGTQTGKTTFLVDLIISLARTHDPEEFKFVILNPKNEPFLNKFARLPHLLGEIAVDYEDAATLMRYCVGEMTVRKDDPARMKASRVVIIIDEIAELIQVQPEIGLIVTRLSQFAGGLNMNLVLASQAANPRVFGEKGSLAKANFGSSITFQLPRDQSYLATRLAGLRTDTLGRNGDGLAVVGHRVSRFRAAWPAESDIDSLPRSPRAPSLNKNLVAGDVALEPETVPASSSETDDRYPSPEETGDMLAYAVAMRASDKSTASANAIRKNFKVGASRASWIRDVAQHFRERADYWQALTSCEVDILGGSDE